MCPRGYWRGQARIGKTDQTREIVKKNMISMYRLGAIQRP